MLNRKLQLDILLQLNRTYPDSRKSRPIKSAVGDPREFDYNLKYLCGHGLVDRSRMHRQHLWDYKITVKGIDFLADDGGLSAILNTVTVKFDIENTRELLTSGLLSMGFPEKKKGVLRTAIEGATTETIKDLVKGVLSNPAGAIDLAQSLLKIVF